LPRKSRETLTCLSPCLADARHTPWSSLRRPETAVKPAFSIRSLAWASVKLLAPAIGGFLSEAGGVVCAIATLSPARARTRGTIITSFLGDMRWLHLSDSLTQT